MRFVGIGFGQQVKFSAVVCFYEKKRGKGVLYDYALKDVMDVKEV